MIVAIPMDASEQVYHFNPCSAESFSLYEISRQHADISFHHTGNTPNPWKTAEGKMVHSPIVKSCSCDVSAINDAYHISEHYALLEVIGRVAYLIVDQCCLNTYHVMRNVGIKIHKIPPFIKSAEEAINHLIIGVGIADNLQQIHPHA